MRAPISIIIPTLDAAEDLATTIPSLIEGLEAGLIRELILSDGGSTDATRAVADAAGAIWLSAPGSRGARLQRGAEAARGDWLLFLKAGTALSKGWGRDLGDVLARPGAYRFRLRYRGRGVLPRLAAGGANLRAGALGMPHAEHGLLIDRASYAAAGGYPDQPLMEDVALALALDRRITGLGICAELCPRTHAPLGWLRHGTRNTLNLMRYLAGADPGALRGAYRG